MSSYNEEEDEYDRPHTRDRYDEEEYNSRQHEQECPGVSGDSVWLPKYQREPESQYNNGLSIKVVIAFQPKHPPLEPGQRRRANAKKPVAVKTSTHVHENMSFDEMLDGAISSLELDDNPLPYKIVGVKLRTNAFSITWSISGSDFQDMKLCNDQQYEKMKEEVAESCSKNDKATFHTTTYSST
ncbi:hypothetical protein B0H11DRAFT_2227181 [Mycena galericulata]|nr:hypothetical protein B0H11DRAFT_2227181 [Mycena galericulata]